MASLTFIAALAALLCLSQAYKPSTLPVFALCDKSPTRCIRGTRCVGLFGRRRCMRPTALGGLCLKSPYRYCSRGQKCWNGRCSKMVSLKGICRGKYVRCLTGLVCRSWRCVRAPYVRPGGRCRSFSSRCYPGYSCAGRIKFKRCIKVIGLNGICKGRYVRCRTGLVCSRWRCVRLGSYIRPGGRCSLVSKRCSLGFSCVGLQGSVVGVSPWTDMHAMGPSCYLHQDRWCGTEL